ncbi:hypothetical protein LV457_06735 [Mycobacterium sp. MYCO198283]|uniref:hypothetical protein n=1 Tax=Mycobacterium sp. MYCO198283 TaxID=2883505 RepID=UPI001E4595B7|nr:hypothetical protein [Mycobacterium sp. MYCO198283]MCG5431986.1 hypothetical protein [Mycobacterium sp. MYCO198283]
MRNLLRVLAFDVVAPAAAIAALVVIGVVLRWPVWWVSVCSVLTLLIVQAVIVNAVLARRDGVTMGTDDDGPGLRLAVVAVATAALVAAAVVGYTRWTQPDRTFAADRDQVVDIAAEVTEAYASFSPDEPAASMDKAAALMTDEEAASYRQEFPKQAAQLQARRISATAHTVSAGVQALGTAAASVAVLLHIEQNAPNTPARPLDLTFQVALTKQGETWRVVNILPLPLDAARAAQQKQQAPRR